MSLKMFSKLFPVNDAAECIGVHQRQQEKTLSSVNRRAGGLNLLSKIKSNLRLNLEIHSSRLPAMRHTVFNNNCAVC